MLVRRAEEKDMNAIIDLLNQVLMVHHNGRPDLFKADCRKYTDSELLDIIKDDNRPIFVGVNDAGNVCGYAFCVVQQHIDDNILTDIKTLYIDDLCVDENKRQGGVGSIIYKYVLDFAKNNGFYNVTLNVWECNPSAKAFYEKCGLKPYKTGMEVVL